MVTQTEVSEERKENSPLAGAEEGIGEEPEVRLSVFIPESVLPQSSVCGRVTWGIGSKGASLFLRVQLEEAAALVVKSDIQCVQLAEQAAVVGVKCPGAGAHGSASCSVACVCVPWREFGNFL